MRPSIALLIEQLVREAPDVPSRRLNPPLPRSGVRARLTEIGISSEQVEDLYAVANGSLDPLFEAFDFLPIDGAARHIVSERILRGSVWMEAIGAPFPIEWAWSRNWLPLFSGQSGTVALDAASDMVLYLPPSSSEDRTPRVVAADLGEFLEKMLAVERDAGPVSDDVSFHTRRVLGSAVPGALRAGFWQLGVVGLGGLRLAVEDMEGRTANPDALREPLVVDRWTHVTGIWTGVVPLPPLAEAAICAPTSQSMEAPLSVTVLLTSSKLAVSHGQVTLLRTGRPDEEVVSSADEFGRASFELPASSSGAEWLIARWHSPVGEVWSGPAPVLWAPSGRPPELSGRISLVDEGLGIVLETSDGSAAVDRWAVRVRDSWRDWSDWAAGEGAVAALPAWVADCHSGAVDVEAIAYSGSASSAVVTRTKLPTSRAREGLLVKPGMIGEGPLLLVGGGGPLDGTIFASVFEVQGGDLEDLRPADLRLLAEAIRLRPLV